MQPEFVQVMDRIPSHALSVFVFLEERSTLDTLMGCTQQEISRATRLSVGAVREGLGWLAEPRYHDAMLTTEHEIAPFLRIVKYSKAHKITLLMPYVVQERELRFTFEDTDSRRIENLEKEVRRLATKRTQNTRLSLYLRGEKQALIREIEGDLGRPLSIEDAYFLGFMIEGFGPERVRKAWRTKAANMDKPIIGLYAMFMNGMFGQRNIKQEVEKEVSYPTLKRDDTII